MTKRIFVSLIFLSLLLQPLLRAEELNANQTDMNQMSMRQRIAVTRQERYEQMPYLAPSFIRSVINKESFQKKQQFLDESPKAFKDLLERASYVHTQIKVARERISLARRRILVAVRNLFPEGNYEFQEREGMLSDLKFNSFSYRVNLKQPIFRGGTLWNTLLVEKMGLEQAENEYDAVVMQLVFDLSQAYIEYSRTVQVIKDQKEELGKMKPYVDISNRKYKEAIISEIEQLNVQSSYEQLQFDQENAIKEWELAKLDMQRFLGLDFHEEIELKTAYDIEKYISDAEAQASADVGADAAEAIGEPKAFEGELKMPDLTELVDLAYQHRPELRVEAAKLQAARLTERVEWGRMLPQVDLSMEFGKLGEAFDVLSTDPGLRKEFRIALEMKWNLGGNNLQYTFEHDERAPSVTQFQQGSGSDFTRNQLQVGIFDGLSQFVSIKESEVRRLEQIVELERKEKEVMRDVKEAYFDHQKAVVDVQASLRRVTYHERLSKIAQHRLEKNEIQISEYLKEKVDLLQEQVRLHRALADYYRAKAQLNHAVGQSDLFNMETHYE